MEPRSEFDLSELKLPPIESGPDMAKLRLLIDRLTEHVASWEKLAPKGSREPEGITRMKNLKVGMETALDLMTTDSGTLPKELQARTLIKEFVRIATNK